MNNTQLYLSIGLPTFTSLLTLTIVVLGWFISRADNSRLGDKIDASNRDLNNKMESSNRDFNSKIDAFNRDLNNKIDASNRDLNIRIDALRNETLALRNQIHQDMVMLHERIVKVEAKQVAG